VGSGVPGGDLASSQHGTRLPWSVRGICRFCGTDAVLEDTSGNLITTYQA
jgi:hypothetical protein